MSVTAKPVSSYLEDNESEEYRLVDRGGGVERTSAGSTTKLATGGDGGSVLCVTNGRVLFVVGNGERQGTDAIVSLPYPEIDEVTVKDGLLRTNFTVSTVADETFSISPDEGELEPAGEYIREVVYDWERTVDLLEKAEYLADRSADEKRSGQSSVLGKRTESALKRASDSFAKVRGRPIERIEDRRQQLKDLWLDSYVSHAEDCWKRAEDARDAGDLDLAITELEGSLDAFDRAETIADDHGFGNVDHIRDRIDELSTVLDTVRTRPAKQAGESIETATTVSDPGEQLAAWRTARDAYETILASEWASLDLEVEDEEAAVRYQLTWIEASLRDRLQDRAAALSMAAQTDHEAGDDESARAQYKQARAHLHELQELTNGDEAAVPKLEEKISALEHEIEMTKWEWGAQ